MAGRRKRGTSLARRTASDGYRVKPPKGYRNPTKGQITIQDGRRVLVKKQYAYTVGDKLGRGLTSYTRGYYKPVGKTGLNRGQVGTAAFLVGGSAALTAGLVAEENHARKKEMARQAQLRREAAQRRAAKTRAANHPTNRTANPNANRQGGKKGRKGHAVRGANGKFAGWSS